MPDLRALRLPSGITVFAAMLLMATGASTLRAQTPVNIRHAVTATASVRVTGAFAELRIRGWNKDTVAIIGTVPNEARFDGGFLAPATASPGAKFYLETP